MVLLECELEEILTRNTVNAESLGLLWEVDSEKVYGLVVSGEEAIASWNYLRQLTDETGYYPLLLGSEDEFDRHRQSVDDYTEELRDEGFPVSINEIIERGSTLDSNGWLGAQTQQMYEEQYDELLDDGEPLEDTVGELIRRKSYAIRGWRSINREQRVRASGTPSIQASKRIRLRAVAIRMC